MSFNCFIFCQVYFQSQKNFSLKISTMTSFHHFFISKFKNGLSILLFVCCILEYSGIQSKLGLLLLLLFILLYIFLSAMPSRIFFPHVHNLSCRKSLSWCSISVFKSFIISLAIFYLSLIFFFVSFILYISPIIRS